MTPHLPSRGARVAHPRPVVIPEGDGLLSTHTPPPAAHARKVTTNPDNRAALPLAASSPVGAIPALIAMTAVVLTTTVAAVLVVYADHPDRWTIAVTVVAAIGLWAALLALPALLRRLR